MTTEVSPYPNSNNLGILDKSSPIWTIQAYTGRRVNSGRKVLLLVCQQTYLVSCLLQLTGIARTKAGERKRWLSRWNEVETSISDPLLIISTPTRESTTLIPSLRRRSNLSAFLQARYAQDTKLKAANHSKDLLETLYLLFLTKGHPCELQPPVVSALFSW